MADDWSFLDNVDFGGDWGAMDWAAQTPWDYNIPGSDNPPDWWDYDLPENWQPAVPYEQLSAFGQEMVDWMGRNPPSMLVGDSDWGKYGYEGEQLPTQLPTGTGWGSLSSEQLNNIYNTVTGGAPEYTSDSSGILGDVFKGLNSILGSPLGQTGLGLLMGSVAQNASTPAGSKPYVSSTTDPNIARLMTAMGLAPTELLSSIMNERANVGARGVMTPESLEALKNATLGYAMDPSSNMFNSAILNYITTGGQKTPEEIKALESYEAAMSPQLLQKTQDLIRKMGGGAWSSGPQAQLMQDAIARAQLESAANYAGFLNTQGTELAGRQAKVAGSIPSLTEAYTNPMEWVMKLIAGFELPGEQTRARTDKLAESAGNVMGNIMGKASPTQTGQVATSAYTPYWASILSNAASGIGAGGFNKTIADIGNTVSSLGKLFEIS